MKLLETAHGEQVNGEICICFVEIVGMKSGEDKIGALLDGRFFLSYDANISWHATIH